MAPNTLTSMEGVTIRLARDEDASSWDLFIQGFSRTHHAFSWPWRKIISQTFGHEPRYFIAEDSTGIIGVAPSFIVKSLLFGKALISVPYLNAGGVLAKALEVELALVQTLRVEAARQNVRYTELRYQHPIENAPSTLAVRTHKVAMQLLLQPDLDAQFQTFTKKLRSQIRRPDKDGVVTETFNSAECSENKFQQGLADFFAVFAENMRDLGTPAYPFELFVSTAKEFGERATICVSYLNKKPIASGFLISTHDTTEIPWASSLRDFNRISPNMSMYWASISAAVKRRSELFDFGRSSPDSGTFRFKAQWGAVPLTLHWYYDQAGTIPDINPKSVKFSILTNVWSKLPVSLATAAGRYLTRSLP